MSEPDGDDEGMLLARITIERRLADDGDTISVQFTGTGDELPPYI